MVRVDWRAGQVSRRDEDRAEKLEQMQEQLTGAVEALVSSADWRRAMAFAARFRSRSFNNTLLIWAQHLAAFEQGRVPEPVPSYVAGFKQWRTLGRAVRSGEPGYRIYAPITVRMASSTPDDAASWRRLAPGEKQRPGEVVRRRAARMKPAYVWDVSLTSGAELPSRPAPRLLDGAAPHGLWEGLTGLVEERGFTVQLSSVGQLDGANGLTDHLTRTVSVREDMDAAARVKTLAHELGHVMMHSRDDPDVAQHRGIKEVEAESVALMVGAAHGLDTSDYTVPYVATWATRVPDTPAVDVVKATGERVRRTAVAILDALPTEQVGNGDPPGLALEPTAGVTVSAPAALPERHDAQQRIPATGPVL
ncbi:ArdC-like ssDNA-binding domain-containing protein [Jiangella anatolica]|uniref:Serine/arginine repetitive matrix protein 2 n=1 Tax=Jiangella anatolica TaxID=2670374 RepID=A0A2W2BJ45_9ACTN|nr:serine/arginine repetitive matrix protein 2 [Jiangella anatolica]